MVSRRDRRRMKRTNVRLVWFGERAVLIKTVVMIVVSSTEVWNGLGEVRRTLCGLGRPLQRSPLIEYSLDRAGKQRLNT